MNRRQLLEFAAVLAVLTPLVIWLDDVWVDGPHPWWADALYAAIFVLVALYVAWWRSRLPTSREQLADLLRPSWVTARQALQTRFRRRRLMAGYATEEVDALLKRVNADLLVLEDAYTQRIQHGVHVKLPSGITSIEEIRWREFCRKRRGYNDAEVDVFLDNVVWTMERLLGVPEERDRGTP